MEEGEDSAPPPSTKPWHSYISEDLPRILTESTDSAVRSARSLHRNSSVQHRSLQDLASQMRFQFGTYDDALFRKFKGPRRFLLHHTLGRLQGEEAQFVRAEKNVKELNLSVDLMKKESKKLLERAALAEKEMLRGQSELMIAGKHIQQLSRSVYRTEAQAAELMDGLREMPGRGALQLRAEIASVASLLRTLRTGLKKRLVRLSEMAIPV